MKPIPFDSRRKNLDSKPGTWPTCNTCADTGFVTVNQRPAQPVAIRPDCTPQGAYEEMGPCPFCQAGWSIEFPVPQEGGKSFGPWGPDGFWQGRDSTGLEQLYTPGARELSKEENRVLWRQYIGANYRDIAQPVEAEAA